MLNTNNMQNGKSVSDSNVLNKKENMWINIGVVSAALILALFLYWGYTSSTKEEAKEEDSTSSLIIGEDVGRDEKVSKLPAKEKTLTYQEALNIYKDRRIQLNDNCEASPVNVTYKNNTSVMIDNRSSVDRVVNLGTVFTVKKYGFKIINLSSNVLPKTLMLDCGSKQNTATILLQK